MPARELAAAGVDVDASLAAWPAPKVPADAAAKTAEVQLAAANNHGPLLTVGRGTAKQFEDPTSPTRSVWVVAYGPGGMEAIQGPAAGSQPPNAPITLQIVLVDDQTGEFLRGYVEAGP